MLTGRGFRGAVLAGAIALTLATMASARSRPTVSEAEARITTLEGEVAGLQSALAASEAEGERNRTAVCASAEFEGVTYRPFVCDPRCDAFEPAQYALATGASCGEAQEGLIEIDFAMDFGACVDGECSASSGTICNSSDNYRCDVFRETCITVGLGAVGICGVECSTDADCLETSLQHFEGPELGASLFEPWGIDSAGAVVYRDATHTASIEDLPLNSNDAFSCVAEVETAFGVSCSYLCGNGALQPGEQCDDGNTTPGDGCDASCQVAAVRLCGAESRSS